MVGAVLALALFAAVAPEDEARPTPAPLDSAEAKVVRRFPPVEVRALLPDMRSSQTVHPITGAALRNFPVDGLADVLALQAGVVAQGEELHVRGGRAGEVSVNLEGLGLNDPLRQRPIDVPLFALRSAELVSGTPEARYGGGLAGVLDLHTVDVGERPSAEWRWQTDGRLDTHYDRIAARIGTPVRPLGLGVVAAGDATLDDASLPGLRTKSRHEIAGLSFGWRAENRLSGYMKLASLGKPERFSAQVLVNRQVHEPYSPSWSLDGWTQLPENPKSAPIFSPVPLPGYLRYRAADHLAITDESQIATLLKLSTLGPTTRASVSLGWLRTRSVTSVGGGHETPIVSHRPLYGGFNQVERFYVLWGDYPLYRESGGDVYTLRVDGEKTSPNGGVATGVGLTYEDVTMFEEDWQPLGKPAGEPGSPFPVDSLRAYHAYAPGGFAYVQGRWLSGGLILNTGLRLDYFTPGPQASEQTLPGSDRGFWSLAPRLGIAYPISVRDVFSLAYVRIHQAPARDYLYDHRTAISDRQPLGNPALEPSTVISYEAAVKHLFSAAWAMQASVFYRDVFGQVGARDAAIPEGPINLRYANEDDGHAMGFEWSLIHAAGERARIEAHYTWMQAWGNESRPEGDPYGPLRSDRTPPLGDLPLSWDRRHSFLVSGAWRWQERWSLSWSTAVGSPLPWTPKPLRQPLTDLSVINSRRFEWTEATNVNLEWRPPRAHGLTLGLEARNLFDTRGEAAATVDGYPNPLINTVYDDYSAYRTETGLGGGAYWSSASGTWVPVHDPRLYYPPRTLRASIGASW